MPRLLLSRLFNVLHHCLILNPPPSTYPILPTQLNCPMASIPFFSTLSSANDGTRHLALRLIRWVTGFSLSTITLFFILFLITIVLRRKGYGVRLGMACFILYARPGSRRFPDGVEVRISTRLVGFIFGGARGPWLDVYSDRFYMRLRPTAADRPAFRTTFPRLARFLSLGVAAVNPNMWVNFLQNILNFLLIILIRGLRVRVEKIRVWKDGGSWDLKAEQLVLAGHAVGLFGSQYSLSVNELYVNLIKHPRDSAFGFDPVNASLALRRGVEVISFLTPRVSTLLQPRRLAVLDDIRLSVSVRDVSCAAPRLLDASITHLAAELCPGHSRSLRAKLPPSAPPTRRPRKPSILRFWEGNGAIHGLSIRFTAPLPAPLAADDDPLVSSLSLSTGPAHASSQSMSELLSSPPNAENGAFVRLESIRLEAYGKAADERFEAMTHASVSLRGCSAGSIAVDALSHSLYEAIPATTVEDDSDSHDNAHCCVESVENIDKIVAARPEFLVWMEDLSAALDINCSKRHATRVDVAGSGGVVAIEPVGLVILVKGVSEFLSHYFERSPRRQASSSSLDTESVASIPRSASSSSLHSSYDDVSSARLVADLRHLTAVVLGRGPVGDGDTMAIVLSSEAISLPQIDLFASSLLRVLGTTSNLSLMHWSRWARTTNVVCKEAEFEIQRGPVDEKNLTLTDCVIEWDLDAQSGIQALPAMLGALKQLRPSFSSVERNGLEVVDPSLVSTQSLPRSDYERAYLSESERNVRREKRHSRLLDSLRAWTLSGSDISVTASFPDGPKMGFSVGVLPSFKLNSESFFGRHVVWTVQDCKFAYGAELKIGSPFHTLRKSLEKRSINIEVSRLKVLVDYEIQFGYLLQDWLLRLRSAIRVLRELRMQQKGIPVAKQKNTPIPDIHFRSSSVELFFEDHPIGSFLTTMLPLMHDEAREREKREDAMAGRIEQLRKIARAEIAGTPGRCLTELMKKDCEIWVKRVQELKKSAIPIRIANGYLPDLKHAPASVFAASTLSFDVVLDDLARQNGSTESIRRLKMLDDYELGSKKYNKTRHHESDAWNSIGFRTIGLEATNVSVCFRDYDVPFLVIDRMYFDNTTIGQAVQATVAPYIAETKVAIGRRRVVKVVKGLGPSKTYCDIHLKIDTLQCGFNMSYLTTIVDFGRGIARFFGGGKNPSPRIPWFDSLRVSMHGRMRITAKKFKGHLTSSISPYSMTKHFAEIDVDNFEMLTSRLEPSVEDPFPISWKFYNWHIRPSSFHDDRKSEIVFDFVRVGLNPVFTVSNGDPQDHYFVPFPTKEEVTIGGPGIGKGTVTLEVVDEPVTSSDNGFGNFTDWYTGLHEIPGHDSYEGFKTRGMILGIDVCVRHPKSRLHPHHGAEGVLHSPFIVRGTIPSSTSIVYSDAISTMTKVIKALVWRPISCRLPARRVSQQRKPPSLTGFSTSLRGLDVTVDVKDLNVMLHNNLEPGHGLFVSIDSLQGELWKRTDITVAENGDIKRDSRLTRRRFEIIGISSSIKVPGLDMAVDADDMGKLLTVDKIALSDDVQDELRYMASPRRGRTAACASGVAAAASGFGAEDMSESPFYTFSANHPLQRGEKLDKVTYDKRLLVDRVRLIWSPIRRSSVFAWPDAFKEKTFTMKAPKKHWADSKEKEDINEKKSQDMFERLITRPLASDKESTTSESSQPYEATSRDSTSDTENMPTLVLTGGRAADSSGNDSVEMSESQSAGNLPSLNMDPVDFEKDSTIIFHEDDPLSPSVIPMTRSKIMVKRKHVGDMKDLLSPQQSPLSTSEPSESRDSNDVSLQKQVTTGAMDVLKTSPQFAMYINDCEVAFGSPETVGFVFLTSKSVRMGIVDKQVQKLMQLGERNEQWVDREYRVHLDATEIFTREKMHGKFDFSAPNWVPHKPTERRSMALVTSKPICMDLMYVVSSSTPRDDGEEEEEDHILRPSLLFINIPDIRLSTNAEEFHAVTDVVRKVLMQSMKSSEIVNEELTQLRYKLQLAEGKASSDELDDFMRRLNNITKQFLYAGDTFQQNLVDALLLPQVNTFSETLLRYKAKAKAVATFMRKDQRAMTTDVLYPTMYVSYSFDKCSWELREKHKEMNKETEDPFVEITLEDLVCRHIFFVGRGSSTEITFANISAQNKMRSSYFQRILQPASTGTNYGPGGYKRKASRIKASDGSAVAFRWYSTQEDRVGGIPVYELLTIQVAPMTAAVTRKLYSSVSEFIFSSTSRPPEDEEIGQDVRPHGSFSRGGAKLGSHHSTNAQASSSVGRTRSFEVGASGRRNGGNSSMEVSHSKMDDVSQMTKRGESSMLFKYVFIDAFELTASYKNKENNAWGALDFFDLFVTTPSFSYSSQVWTWKDFSSQIRRDLVMTFFLRGASNLAKIKLLPGYSRARKRLTAGIMQGADNIRGSFYARLPAAVSGMDGDHTSRDDEELEGDLATEVTGHTSDEGDVDGEEVEDSIDAAAADISGEEGTRREEVMRVLYGNKGGSAGRGQSSTTQLSRSTYRRSNKSHGGSDTSTESYGARTSIRTTRGRPPAAPSTRSRTTERAPHSLAGGEGESGAGGGLLRRLRRKAHDLR